MARVNAEERWWTDPRRLNLISKMNHYMLADGCMANAWRLAQQYWKDNHALIPLHIWEEFPFHNEIVEVKLAEIRSEGIYIKGAAKEFLWIEEEKEKNSKAGKASAEARKAKYGTAQPQNSKKGKRKAPNKPRTTPKVFEEEGKIGPLKDNTTADLKTSSNIPRTEMNTLEASYSSSSSSSTELILNSVCTETDIHLPKSEIMNSTEKYNLRFNPEVKKIRDKVHPVFGRRLSNHAEKLFDYFGSFENLDDYLAGLDSRFEQRDQGMSRKEFIVSTTLFEIEVIRGKRAV